VANNPFIGVTRLDRVVMDYLLNFAL
jgi:hypothetical protein